MAGVGERLWNPAAGTGGCAVRHPNNSSSRAAAAERGSAAPYRCLGLAPTTGHPMAIDSLLAEDELLCVDLDGEGRVPCGPLDYGFRACDRFLALDDAELESLGRDAATADSLLHPKTFFLRADEHPACGLEALARHVFDRHAPRGRGAFDRAASGAEWWVQWRDEHDDGRSRRRPAKEITQGETAKRRRAHGSSTRPNRPRRRRRRRPGGTGGHGSPGWAIDAGGVRWVVSPYSRHNQALSVVH